MPPEEVKRRLSAYAKAVQEAVGKPESKKGDENKGDAL